MDKRLNEGDGHNMADEAAQMKMNLVLRTDNKWTKGLLEWRQVMFGDHKKDISRDLAMRL